jgi:Uma2 family endonuclease
MPVSEATYLRLVEEDPEHQWEPWCGELRSRPPMTWEHIRTAATLGHMLQHQLDAAHYLVISEAGRLRRSESRYYVPDVMVVPLEMAGRLFDTAGQVAAFPEPLPLVVEVWPPSTGNYDVTEKLPEYQRRGDLEIWLIHPYARTLTAWVRQPDGGYREHRYVDGLVLPAALPNVAIDLNRLFGA